MDDKENVCVCGVNRDMLLAKGLAVCRHECRAGKRDKNIHKRKKKRKPDSNLIALLDELGSLNTPRVPTIQKNVKICRKNS